MLDNQDITAKSGRTILIKNGFIVSMNKNRDVMRGDILVSGNMIDQVGKHIDAPSDEVFDAGQFTIVPGLIQTHVHLCQTLFRNLADDLSLLEWLQEKIWPFEGNLNRESLKLSARLGIAELIKSGTTTILDMGTVHHHDAVFEELAQSGMRAFSGKAMMDYGDMPASLKETTRDSIQESLRLLKKWHNFDDGRLKYAFAPRFVLSCSEELLKETGKLAAEYGILIHTHASENQTEAALVEKRFNATNILFFDRLGLAGENLCLAHCIWTNGEERELLRDKKIKVMHCPSANLKLGSGIAPIPDYLENGIVVSLGADGAPCNNNLDIFTEMRLAALIQKPHHGPQAMPAEKVFEMATVNGAATLGMAGKLGSIESGKYADLTFIKTGQVHSIPFENVYSKLVYSTKSSDVSAVMVNGSWLLRDKNLTTINIETLLHSVENFKSKIKL